MAQGRGPLKPSMLDTYITATRPVTVEDRYGDRTATSNTTVANFWGMVKELESSSDFQNGKKRITRTIEIHCRRDDVAGVEIDDILTFGNAQGEEYQVNDYFESDWRWGMTLIAEYKI